MKTTTTIHLRRFPVQILDERTGFAHPDTIVLDKRSLQASQQIGLSSADMIFREYNKRGFTVLQIGKAEKHGSIPKAAAALGLAKQTLYNWVSASDDPRVINSPVVQKSKNHNVNVYVSEYVYDYSDTRNKNKPLDAMTTDPNGSPSRPAKQKDPEWVPPD